MVKKNLYLIPTKICQQLENKSIIVALSGGIDSISLLHSLTQQIKVKNISAIHINHQIQKEANLWQKHCQKICTAINIPLKIEKINVSSKNMEADAREKRYAIFKQMLSKNEYLCLGHHQNDQAETLILQLLRGCGVQGLAAMLEIKKFNKGYLVRPLLDISKKKISLYAKQHNLQWVEDPSNKNNKQRRNIIRNIIFPILNKYWLNSNKNIARSAKHQQTTIQLLSDLAKQDINIYNLITNNKINLTKLLQLPEYRIVNILRDKIKEYGFSQPNEKRLNEFIKQIQK